MVTRLLVLMRKKGIKNIELARQIGVGEAQVSHWKACRNYIPPKHHKALAEFLGVSIEEIIDSKTNLPRFIEEV